MSAEAVQTAPATSERLAGVASPALVFLTPFAIVLGLASAQGGFFPSSWGWGSLPLLWLVALVLALRETVTLHAREGIFIGLVLAVCLWVLLSSVWSVAPARSILESQRALVYAAGAAAVLVLASGKYLAQLLAGVYTAVTAISLFSLATRVFPDRVGVFDRTSVYRLAQPIGYWNGLAIFAGLGALLALAFAARARSVAARACAAATLVPLLATFYFTFGRGAWIALAVGVAVSVAVDPRRLQLLAVLFTVAPATALGVWLSSREPGLTHPGASLASATHDGHELALRLLLLAAVNAVAAAVFTFVARRYVPGVNVRRAFAAAVSLAAIAALIVVFARYGGPVTLAEKGYDAFRAPPPGADTNLNNRLLSFSGNGRAELWRLAWDDAGAHPVLGAGGGTYERFFLAHQPQDVSRVRDAHGLYIETLAELGPFGLALLLAAFAVPLAAIPRARRHPLAPLVAGAYAAYLVHTGADWDWELPAVTLVGLFCGAALLVAARGRPRLDPLGPWFRWGGVAAAVVLSVGAAVGLVGNMELSQSSSAREDGNWGSAAAAAHTAHSWMPWSPTPWDALGRAQRGAGLRADARVSFRKALALDDGDWELWYDLATVSRGAERRRALQEARKLFPRADFLRASKAVGR